MSNRLHVGSLIKTKIRSGSGDEKRKKQVVCHLNLLEREQGSLSKMWGTIFEGWRFAFYCGNIPLVVLMNSLQVSLTE